MEFHARRADRFFAIKTRPGIPSLETHGIMKTRGLKSLADFDLVQGSHVEAHLTDLAVDGNVAPSTQNQAFHALLAFFTLVLKQDIGRIEAIRATKGKQVPTVMEAEEVGAVKELQLTSASIGAARC